MLQNIKLTILEILLKKIITETGAGQWGTDTLRRNYQNATPGQEIKRFKDYSKHK